MISILGKISQSDLTKICEYIVKKILFGLTLGNFGPTIELRDLKKSWDFGTRQVVQKRGPEKQSLPFWKVLLYLASSWLWDEISMRQK